MSAELIAKLESASEGSRELDEQINDTLCDSKFRTRIAGLSDEHGGMWMYEFEGYAPSSALRVTQSVDAALALAERVLPGTTFRIDLDGVSRVWAFDKETFWNIHATINSRPKEWSAHAQASTPALAICAAILRASAAEGAGHE